MMVMIVLVEVVVEFDLENLNELIFVRHIVVVVVVVVDCHSTSVLAMNHLIKKNKRLEKKMIY
jgi:hypothetical protein